MEIDEFAVSLNDCNIGANLFSDQLEAALIARSTVPSRLLGIGGIQPQPISSLPPPSQPRSQAPNRPHCTDHERKDAIDRALNPSSMAAPTPTPIPLAQIESSAASPAAAAVAAAAAAAPPPSKLPIKRKKTPQPHSQEQPQPHLSSPDPLLVPAPSSSSSDPPLAADQGFDEDDDYDDGDDDYGAAAAAGSAAPIDVRAGGASAAAAPPFRFQRVWSESDEIRFLQGLLGCWSQGLVFPRDLNLFFDRFSESMPQPYTRSQLSEKLRRLRKKFRVMSSRIARGQDPARLAPHDRDVLHLCTRLWHPSYAASSPFSAPDALAPGSGGNKRRRPNPRAPTGQARPDNPPPFPAPPPPPPPAPIATLTPPPPLLALPPPTDEKVACIGAGTSVNAVHPVLENEEKEVKVEKEEKPLLGVGRDEVAPGIDVPRHLLAKTILDVFDACLNEFKVTVAGQGLVFPGGSASSGAAGRSDLEQRWREQRVTELDVLGRRLRLVVEKTIQN
ncbi:unnamed protein product [Musa acuminata subsp. burmannicoides]